MPTYDYHYREVMASVEAGLKGTEIAENMGIPTRTAQHIARTLKEKNLTSENFDQWANSTDARRSWAISWGKLNPAVQQHLITKYINRPTVEPTPRPTHTTPRKFGPPKRRSNGRSKSPTFSTADQKALNEMLTWWKSRDNETKTGNRGESNQVIRVRLPESLLSELKAEASVRGVTLSEIIRARLKSNR